MYDVPGGHTGGATPVPIPNTEVKPSKADDTAAVRQWESRTLPGYKKSLLVKASRLFHFPSKIAKAAWSSPVLAQPRCYIRSTTIASASPPPIQRLANPRLAPRASMA